MSPFLRNIVFRTLPRPFIKHDKCNLCEICMEVCPSGSISIKKNKMRIDYRECISCFCCQENCPSNAIKIKRGLVGKILRKI
ncbi:MAG: 4Fe-4S binding protein [Acidobacteriota bacterium]